MKLVEKLAEDFISNNRVASLKSALCYEAGFRKALELAAKQMDLHRCVERKPMNLYSAMAKTPGSEIRLIADQETSWERRTP